MQMTCMKFRFIYRPRQSPAVDKRMLVSHAGCSIKQNMKAKPTMWGLEFFWAAYINSYTIYTAMKSCSALVSPRRHQGRGSLRGLSLDWSTQTSRHLSILSTQTTLPAGIWRDFVGTQTTGEGAQQTSLQEARCLEV